MPKNYLHNYALLNCRVAIAHPATIKLAILTFLISTWINTTSAQTVVWQDDFDLPTVNTDSWTYDFGDGSQRAPGFGWGNAELEYYTSRPDNVRVENGSLIIEARRENFGPASNFTSGRVKTEGRIHFKYGTVEARIKLPNVAKGIWPAFWTLGTIGGSWPSIGEIDMLEVGSGQALAAGLGNRQVSAAAHWGNTEGAHQYNVLYNNSSVDLSEDYHLYKMVWTSSSIKMYLDNVEFYSFDISDKNAPWYNEFHTPHFLLLNLAVGGNYTGIYDANGISASLPCKMFVDYIKISQNAGDELYIGKDDSLRGNFGVLTETTTVTDSLSFGNTANLYYWNNLSEIKNTVPFEGKNSLAVHANANDWFGMGIVNNYVNLHNFSAGSLKFHYKSTYQGQLKIGLTTGHGETWMNFPAGKQPYGLIRDGNWHEVSIPLADFSNSSLGMNIDIWSLKSAFMFAGDPAISNADFYFDNIYYSDGATPNLSPSISITTPVNNNIFKSPASITINATADDSNGSISKVDFYNGNTLLGSDLIAPYSVLWNDVPTGNYGITAQATDNDGNITVSVPVTFQVAPTACTGTAVNGDYSYEVYTDAGSVYFKFHPLAPILGSTYALIYLRETGSGIYPGYNMIPSGSDFTFSKPIADGVTTSFYFSYQVPSGGERNSSSDPHAYVVGTVCVEGAPSVSITTPVEAESFVAPASITINATATDGDGSISKVEFFNGSDLLGTSSSSPYSFTWSNVAAGSYTLTAKATDNSDLSSSSIPVNIVVNAPNTNGYCGTAFNGDYEYKAETNNELVTFTFHPLQPIVGCQYALIYIREGLSGGYAGYGMTASGTDFIFSKTIANNTPISIYFTYQTPPAGERNSSANPHSYTVGTNCIGIVGQAPTIAITSPVNNTRFTEPASILINVDATDADGTISKVEFYSGPTLIGSDDTSPYSFEWNNVMAGNYTITSKATDNDALFTTSTPVNVVVEIDNSGGFCDTLENGDYSYKVETVGDNVLFQFHPLPPIEGCSYVFIYVREGTTGGYPGYAMTRIGSDFIFEKAIGSGTPLSIYFTYNVPSGGERNSSATPHDYTVGTICEGLLPVNLIAFNAAKNNDGSVVLNWSTASESNNDYYIIERSADARSYKTISRVEASNLPSIKNDYQVTDEYPMEGLNYYRLVQVDKDGLSTFHGVKSVEVSKRKSAAKIYPNPLHGTGLNIKLNQISDDPVLVQIININGKLIHEGIYKPTAGLLKVALDVKPAAGIYLVKIGGSIEAKLIVE